MVDKSKVYRYELGEWDNPESFIPLGMNALHCIIPQSCCGQ